VQRADARLRVNVQLLEAESGKQLWADRFDKPIADLLDMQDEIVARLANQLQAELVAAEARRAEGRPNPDSMDLAFQGRAMLNRGQSPDMLAKARGFYERALELDPDNLDALAGVGSVYAIVGCGSLTDDPASAIAAAETSLLKALALSPNHAPAHATMGYLLSETNRAPRAIEHLERALAIDPNRANAHDLLGNAQIFMGRAEETEAHVLEALRLSPRDAWLRSWFFHAGMAKTFLGEYEEALTWLRKSIDANRNHPWSYFFLAACLARLGRLEDARREVKAGLAVDPKYTLRRFRSSARSENAVYRTQFDRVEEGMRMAGVPEG
jgi:tetratricopeptide (TPR) repeat protein